MCVYQGSRAFVFYSDLTACHTG
ncbi:unnamed protein product [Acanthoscelides obtectus]|uniref:Uncharacterized protein n=1 Tax=Acanthoscelides obtectus TaxID=200917 RepID=A0A9P0PCH5_ACAOB|nr:unnamed protein product [Acanthoscelides obtectus]CAK1660063.1 hypothetical protein AOBTE_LOCUS21851 [Acanthoscelides obtectus]